MEPKFKTSFIPKQSLAQQPRQAAKKSGGGGMGIITLVMLVVFLIAVALAVGVFLYQQYLEKSIESKSTSLARAQAAFDPALLEELTRLDSRLDVAGTLLDQHVAPSALFHLLEEQTLQSVQFTNFGYTVLEPGNISLSMQGQADSFNSVALQSNIFGEHRYIDNPIFSDLNIDQQGNVVFSFEASIDPALVIYGNTLNSRRSSNAPQSTSATTTSTGSADDATSPF